MNKNILPQTTLIFTYTTKFWKELFLEVLISTAAYFCIVWGSDGLVLYVFLSLFLSFFFVVIASWRRFCS